MERPLLSQDKINELISLLYEKKEFDKNIQAQYHYLTQELKGYRKIQEEENNKLGINKQAESLTPKTCKDCKFWNKIDTEDNTYVMGRCKEVGRVRWAIKNGKKSKRADDDNGEMYVAEKIKNILTAPYFGCVYFDRINGDIDVATRKVYDEDLSIRALNTLKSNDIEYVGQLVNMEREGLFKWRNFGKKTLMEIEGMMQKYNIKFKTK